MRAEHTSNDGGWLPPHQPHCLGCGDENPASTRLRLRIEKDRVLGEVTLDRRHEGAPGFAHGGAVAVVLDDALGSLLVLLKRPAVTARLEVDYRSPVFLERLLRVEAWIEEVDGRKFRLAGRLLDGNKLVAEAHGLFIEVAVEHFLQSGAEQPEGWRTLPW